jgi:hypothetical protein
MSVVKIACAHLAHPDRIRGFMYDLSANTVTEIPLDN